MSASEKSFKSIARKELLLLLLLIFAGLLLVPIAIYLVGSEVFGNYAGNGFGDFYRNLHGDLRDGQTVVIFLLFSPCLVCQLLRLSFYLFARMAPPKPLIAADPAAKSGAGNL